MSSLEALTAFPEGASIDSAAEMGCSLTLGDVISELMRLQSTAGNRDDLEVFLERLVEATRTLFRATGAAIALRDGDECSWRAKCGDTGPQIGWPLNPGVGISGSCLARGRVQFCRETMSDPRFDAELCRKLRLRSMIVAPIRSATRVEGVLEAWSNEPMAFDGDCKEVLRKLADFSGRAMGLGKGFEKGSLSTFLTAFANPMTSVGRGAVKRARDFIKSTLSRMTSTTVNCAPMLMRLRAWGIFGLVLSTTVGVGWYIRPASARSLPARPLARQVIARAVDAVDAVNDPADTLIASPAPAKVYPVQTISQGRTGGQLLSSVRPAYPVAAIKKEIEDKVVLQAVVDEEGQVAQVSVIKGHPLLAHAAAAALKQWRYEPFLLNNRPVRVSANIVMIFKLK